MAEEINLTYETLFEILIREKNREELQELDNGFLSSVSEYINEKKKILASNEGKDNVFSSKEKEETKRQLDNIHKILRELYDRREKKIMNIAMISSRTSPDIIDKSSMLDKEKVMFDEINVLLKKYRDDILLSTLKSEQTQGPETATVTTPEQAPEPTTETKSESEPSPVEPEPESVKMPEAPQPSEGKKRIMITNPVPKFVGKELEIYGPFNADDETELPSDIADILIQKGRAKEITS